MRHVARVAWHARGVESTDQRRLHCPQTTAIVYAEFVVRRFLLLRWTPRTPLEQWLLAALLCLLRCDRKKRCAALGAITRESGKMPTARRPLYVRDKNRVQAAATVALACSWSDICMPIMGPTEKKRRKQ